MSDDEAEQPLPRTLVSPQRPTVAITDPRRWIVAAGHLEKAKPESSFRSGWGKRYFVLTHSHLFWFKKDDPYEELFGSERNKVKVRDIIASGGVEVRPKQSGDEFAELRPLAMKSDKASCCRLLLPSILSSRSGTVAVVILRP